MDTEGLNEGIVHKFLLIIFPGLRIELLAPGDDITSASQIFQEIHSAFDARNNEELDEANLSPYNTRLSSRQQFIPQGLNLRDNWSHTTPAFIDSSNSINHSDDNQAEMTIPGNYPDIILVYKTLMGLFFLDRAMERGFLSHTTLTTIREELENVKIDLQILRSWEGTKIDNFRGQAEILRGFYTSVLQDPLSGSSIPAISSGWKALEVLDLGERQISVLLRAHRSCIMLTNYLAWYWLDVCIWDACVGIMDKQAHFPDKLQWLVLLVHDVEEAYRLKSRERQFSSSSYGIIIPSGSTTFLFVNKGRNAREGNALRAQVLNTVNEILRSWLCYPTPGQCRIQAWLVHVLVKEFGRSVLYLDSVWKTYTGARRQSIDARSWYISSFKDVKPLELAAANHPLSNPSSSESCALLELATLIDSFITNGFEALPQQDTDKRTTTIPQLESLEGRKRELFVHFVTDSLSIFLEETQGNSKLKKAMDKFPDKLIPFREQAPSRLRLRGEDGPFSKEYARTTKGAYSAAVWRGVTYATPFSILNRMVFTSYDDFELARMEAGSQDEGYFCDKAAYGTFNPVRTVKLAEDYWKTLAAGKWPKFVGDRIVPFTECFNFFTAGKSPPDFPQLGPLASYLLAADFSYCRPKVVDSPTLSEMAILIHSFNKGAVSGLESAGFIPPRAVKKLRKGDLKVKGDLKDIERGFGEVYELLRKIIPAEHQEDINLDLIMTEHTLCKFSRVKARNLIPKI